MNHRLESDYSVAIYIHVYIILKRIKDQAYVVPACFLKLNHH